MAPVLVTCIAVFTVNLGLVVAALSSVPGGGEVASFEELQRAPYFFTAFMLVFSTLGLAGSHSAVLFYNHPFGFDEP